MDRTRSKKDQGIVTEPRVNYPRPFRNRDKALNKPEFNKMVKARRLKAQAASKARRRNRGK